MKLATEILFFGGLAAVAAAVWAYDWRLGLGAAGGMSAAVGWLARKGVG